MKKLKKHLNILHVSTAISWRGGEQQLAYLVKELDEGVTSFVLCVKGSKMEAFCQKNGIDYFCRPKRSGLDLGFAKTLKHLSKKLAIDLCHLHDAHAHTFAILSAVFFRNKTPLILSRRVDFPIKDNWFSKYKYNYRTVAKILCVSNKIKEITAADISNTNKLVTVYSGIDLGKFKARTGKLRAEFNFDAATRLVGNTSAIADHKDYFTFVDVAKQLVDKNTNYKFIVIGDGPLRKEIEKYALAKGMGDKIIFAGFRSDVPEIIADLDVFLITSKTEGLGTSILDSFAAKVPVVATAAGGIPELVEDNISGKLCQVKSIASLSTAVEEIFNNPDNTNGLVHNAYVKVQSFSKEATAQKTLIQYQEVIAFLTD